MPRVVLRPSLPPLALAAAALLGGCDPGRAPAPLPEAEFVVAAGDTSVWVRTGAGGVEVRRAALLLARVDDGFHELYVTEDDYSFHDAVFLSQALWRRDLETGDSLLVYADTVAPRAAQRWAAAHPGDRLLDEDEPGADDPAVTTIGEVVVLDVHGPYADVETFTDVHDARGESHRARRVVVDVRSGQAPSLAALVGAGEARRATAEARRGFARLRDSAVAQVAVQGEARAAAALRRFAFDTGSFALATAGGRPAVVFYVSGHGAEGDGHALPLAPVVVDAGDWWRVGRAELPDGADGAPLLASVDEDPADRAGRVLRWRRADVVVVARPDSTGESVSLAVVDRAGREHRVADVTAPVQRVHWLDDARLRPGARDAVRRAFREGARGGYYRQAARVRAPRALTVTVPAT